MSVTAASKDNSKHRITFTCECVNQHGERVITGTAEVIAPTEKVRRPRTPLPDVFVHHHGAWYRHLIELTAELPPIRTAVVHPVDRNALLGAVEAAREGLIVPILIGPEERIRAVAAAENVDLSPYTIVPTEHSHAVAATAIGLASRREVQAIMKGSLHTDELMPQCSPRSPASPRAGA